GAAGNQGIAHQFVRREFARANNQARRELAIGDLQFRGLVRHYKKDKRICARRECTGLGSTGCAVAAGVPPASSSNSQPTRLPLQTAAIFCLYELVNSATFHFVTKFDLRHEDCIDGMARLGDESVDLVVTSPPYNLGITYRKYSDRQDRQSYLRWCHEWAEQVRRILKPTGSFFLNIGAAPSNPMLPHENVIALRNLFVLQNTIHWAKSIAIEDRKADPQPHGHFKPISSKRFINDCHE